MSARRHGPLRLADATRPDEVGGKAARLAAAMRAGMPVPPAAVLPLPWLAEATDDELHAVGVRLLDELGGAVAVRSSATVEDGPVATWTGQFATVLDVRTPAGVVSAVRDCLRSATATAAQTYGAVLGDGDAVGMAVLVQAMLTPQAAGVASTQDPVDGTAHVVLEAVAGTGEDATSGRSDPERWTVTDGQVPRDTGQVLTSQQVVAVADLARRAEAHLGAPTELEWALVEDRPWLLQLRPSTDGAVQPTVSLPPRQCFRRDPRFDRPLTPLSFTTWLPRHATCIAHAFRRLGLPVQTLDHRHVLGRVYSRAVVVGDAGRDDLAVPDAVLRVLFAVTPTVRRRMRNAEAWDGERPLDELVDAWRDTGRDALRQRTVSLRDRDLTTLTDRELAEHIDTVGEHIVDVGTWHFLLALAGTYVATGRLGLLCEQQLGWGAEDVLELLTGHGSTEGSPADALRRLRAALPDDLTDRAVADPAALLDSPAGRAYLAAHGHRVLVELAQPTEAEDPSGLVARLVQLEPGTGLGERTAALRARAEDAAARARAAFDVQHRARFDRLLATARRARPHGDESELLVHDAITLVRFAALEAAGRLHAAGRLRRRDDVWFLELPELLGLLRDPDVPAPPVRRRRREHAWALANSAPDHLGPEPAPTPGWRAVPKRWRATVGAAFWAFGHEDGAPPAHTDDTHTGGTHRGLAASPGTAQGPARIVRSAADFARVQPGDVLVCPLPMAAWSAVFSTCAAVVTEHGGLLSHPATLARELAIPTVLQIAGATDTFRDGELLRVDGARGTVERV